MTLFSFILYMLAVVFFVLAAFRVSSRHLEFLSLGLVCFTLVELVRSGANL